MAIPTMPPEYGTPPITPRAEIKAKADREFREKCLKMALEFYSTKTASIEGVINAAREIENYLRGER